MSSNDNNQNPSEKDKMPRTWSSSSYMVMEILMQSVLYQILVQGTLAPALRRWMQKQSFWKDMESRTGQIFKLQSEESVFTLAIGIHHFTLGCGIHLATALKDVHLLRHCIAAELGFEIADTLALLLKRWPYANIKPEFIILSMLHHVPNLLSTPFMLDSRVAGEPKLQRIASWMMLAGGVSFIVDAMKQTRNLQTQLGQWLILHSFSLASVFYARMYVYPMEAALMLWKWYKINKYPTRFFTVLVLGTLSLQGFNTILFGVLVQKFLEFFPLWLRGENALHGLVVKA